MSVLPVAIVGMGTVGTGVARVLVEQPDRMLQRTGRKIELRKAVVRDLSKSRDLQLPPGLLTDDLQQVLQDPEIKVGIQLVGGISPAREILLALLEAGKDVVTANKALLCEHGTELFARARELGRTITFEAAVAGGIPIIAVVSQCMTANQITSISAILNGTSNFILTQMIQKGQSYAEALKRAQELGFAEADPTMDVDGSDAAQKLSLLGELAYGTKVPFEKLPRMGIDTLDLADIKYASELGYTIKLLAVSRLVNGKVESHVSPTLVREDTPLAQVNGPFNAIALQGDVVGESWYSGRGAGQMPTASAVLADLVDLAVGRAQLTFERLELWKNQSRFPLLPAEESSSRFYLRMLVEDRPHVLADIADVLGRHEISIASVIQHEAESGENHTPQTTVSLVIMTHRTTAGQLQRAESGLKNLKTLQAPLVKMRVAD